MLGIIKSLLHEDRWEELDKSLTTAFEKIKGETKNIYSWIRYFREKDFKNDIRHDKAEKEISGHAKAIDSHDSSIKRLQEEIGFLKAELRTINQKISPFPNQIRTKSGLESEPEPRTRFDRKIIAISRPVKKGYIMQQIANLNAKGAYTTKQIETIIVKERMLCGRTAFYDYLKELKLKKQIAISEKRRY